MQQHLRQQLFLQLQGLSGLDPLEAEHCAAVTTLLGLPGNVADRNHFQPGHLTASAFVLSPDETQILLILHGKLGLWLQPGGHIDQSDSDLVGAALREVREETGLAQVDVLQPLFDVDVHHIPARKSDPAHLHFDVRVLLRANDWAFAAGSDALAARWLPLADAEVLQTDESVRRAVRKLLHRKNK